MEYKYTVLHSETSVKAFCSKVMEEINLKREEKDSHKLKTSYSENKMLL